MRKMKRFLVCLLLLCLSLSLAACGEERPEAGKYICRGLSRDGELIPGGSGGEIILDAKGGGLFSFDGTRGDIRWSASGERLVLRIGGADREALIKNDCISLPSGEDCTALFYKEGSELPPELLPVDLPESFYGWWRISASEGKMPETWIDLCAAFDAESNVISFWDEDGSRQEPMGEIELYYKPYGDIPQYRSRRGYFWYTEEHDNNFIIKENEQGAYTVTGGAVDSEGDIFSYEIYLRPWGDEWLWERENEPDKLPFYFESWYLPLKDAGEPMPDEIKAD